MEAGLFAVWSGAMTAGNPESHRVCLRLWTVAHRIRARWRKAVGSEPRRLWSRRASHRYDGLNFRRVSYGQRTGIIGREGKN
jgi:hypothetical protein